MIVKAFAMALGMFTIFPVKNSWDEACAAWVVPVLPVVGAGIGLCWYAAAYLLTRAGLPPMLHGVFLLLVPFVLSGFIHLDGYMDTADAIGSRRSLDEKRRILKDPHVGAFAVIAAICLFLTQFCAVYTLVTQDKPLTALIFLPVVSRAAAALALLRLTPIADTGYLALFRAHAGLRHTLAVVACGAACFVLAPRVAVLPLAAAALAGVCVAWFTYKQLQGFSGDLCGCVITAAELAGLLCMAIL